jgi:hypothetical protein
MNVPALYTPEDPDEPEVRADVAATLGIALGAIGQRLLGRLDESARRRVAAHAKLARVRGGDVKAAESAILANFARVARLFGALTDASSRTGREAHAAIVSAYYAPSADGRATQIALAPWITPTLLGSELGEAASRRGVRLVAYALYDALQQKIPVMHFVRIRGALYLVVYAAYADMMWHDAHVLRTRHANGRLFFETATGVERVELGRANVYALCSRWHHERAALFVGMHLMRSVGATLIVPNTQALAELRADKSMADLLPALTDPFEATFTKYHADVAEWAKRGVEGERHAATYGKSILAMLRMHGVQGELELDASSVCSLLLPHEEHYRVADYESDVRPLLEELKAEVEEEVLEKADMLMKKLRSIMCEVENASWNPKKWHKVQCKKEEKDPKLVKVNRVLLQMLSVKATHMLHPTMLALNLVRYLKENKKLNDIAPDFVVGLPDLPGQYAFVKDNGKWVMLYWAFVAMYDAIQRGAALEIGAAYEAHTRRAMTGVANTAGVSCKLSGVTLLDSEPTNIPLHLIPVGACVFAPAEGSKYRVWRRTQLLWFDQFDARPGFTEIDRSMNVRVRYIELNAQIDSGAVQGARGPLYDVRELFETVADGGGGTRDVSSGTQSGVASMLHFAPEKIDTVYAAELDDLLRHIKQIEQKGRMSFEKAVANLAVTTTTGLASVGLATLVGIAAAGSSPLVATAFVGGAVDALTGGTVARAIKAAPQKVTQAVAHIKEKLGTGKGMLSSVLEFAKKSVPYDDPADVQTKIDELRAASSQKGGEQGNQVTTKPEEAGESRVGPVYDPLSIEPGELGRARATELLARDAMERVIEALNAPAEHTT